MNFIVNRHGPEKTNQIEVGAYYYVKGTNSFGQSIPDQVIRILSPPFYPFTVSPNPCVKAMVWMSIEELDQVLYWLEEKYPLGGTNITDHGSVGTHDRHLEKLENDKAHGQIISWGGHGILNQLYGADV